MMIYKPTMARSADNNTDLLILSMETYKEITLTR